MLNNITIMGRLTADPTVKKTPNGTLVCNFSIAVQRPKKKDSETETDFFNCVAWNGAAELIEKYFSKGNMIAIQGYLRNDIYLKNNEKRTVTRIIVKTISFTGEHRKEGDESSSINPTTENIPNISDEEIDLMLSDDGVPF